MYSVAQQMGVTHYEQKKRAGVWLSGRVCEHWVVSAPHIKKKKKKSLRTEGKGERYSSKKKKISH